MQINKVTRKVRLDSRLDAIKYQLVTELMFLRKHPLIDTDLTYLALLVELGPIPLKEFCHKAVLHVYGPSVVTDVEKHPVRVQTVRNRLGVMEKRGLIVKEGKGKKILRINPNIPLTKDGDILLEYNFLYIETQENKRTDSTTRERAGTY
jgi:hypothetical protein